MSSEVFSVIVRCWWDEPTMTTRLQVVRVDTAEEVHLSESTFLLRFSERSDTRRPKCLVRHLSSGREIFVQSSPNLRAFMRACLLEQNDAGASGASPAANGSPG